MKAKVGDMSSERLAEKAIERASRESPDFQERTYNRAALHLSFQMSQMR